MLEDVTKRKASNASDYTRLLTVTTCYAFRYALALDFPVCKLALILTCSEPGHEQQQLLLLSMTYLLLLKAVFLTAIYPETTI